MRELVLAPSFESACPLFFKAAGYRATTARAYTSPAKPMSRPELTRSTLVLAFLLCGNVSPATRQQAAGRVWTHQLAALRWLPIRKVMRNTNAGNYFSKLPCEN
jgi:hypothetical protein